MKFVLHVYIHNLYIAQLLICFSFQSERRHRGIQQMEWLESCFVSIGRVAMVNHQYSKKFPLYFCEKVHGLRNTTIIVFKDDITFALRSIFTFHLVDAVLFYFIFFYGIPQGPNGTIIHKRQVMNEFIIQFWHKKSICNFLNILTKSTNHEWKNGKKRVEESFYLFIVWKKKNYVFCRSIVLINNRNRAG